MHFLKKICALQHARTHPNKIKSRRKKPKTKKKSENTVEAILPQKPQTLH